MKTKIERLIEAGIRFVVCCGDYKKTFLWFILFQDEDMKQYEFSNDELHSELWKLIELHKEGLFNKTITDSGHLIYKLVKTN